MNDDSGYDALNAPSDWIVDVRLVWKEGIDTCPMRVLLASLRSLARVASEYTSSCSVVLVVGREPSC